MADSLHAKSRWPPTRLRTLLLLLTLTLLAGGCLVGWLTGSITWTSRSRRPAVSQDEFSQAIGSLTVRRVGWTLKLMYSCPCFHGSSFPKFAVYQNGRKIGWGNFGYPSGGGFSYWWPVPYSVGDSELQVVLSENGSEPCPNSGQAAVFPWRWYYCFPAWAIWPILVLALIIPKANRHREAWLILLPFVSVLLVWRLLPTLPKIPEGFIEWYMDFPIVSLVMGWTMVWLLGHWFRSRYRSVTVFLLLGLMLVVGGLSGYCHLDPEDMLPWTVIFYVGFVYVLLLSTVVSAHSCRKRCTLQRILGWLILWSGLLAFAGFLLLACSAVVIAVSLPSGGPPSSGGMLTLLPLAIGGVLFLGTVVAFLVNLPFVLLASKNPFYRKRFESIFGVAPVGVSDGRPEDPSA